MSIITKLIQHTIDFLVLVRLDEMPRVIHLPLDVTNVCGDLFRRTPLSLTGRLGSIFQLYQRRLTLTETNQMHVKQVRHNLTIYY